MNVLATKSGAQSRSHRRLAKFVDWIKPDPETRTGIEAQVQDIRRALSGRANADGLKVIATPEAGSFAKHTGLRRHMRGNSEVEGQDVDLPFVASPDTEDGKRIDELLRRFHGYAKASYPTTPSEITNSSVEMEFVSKRLYYDIVPMLQASTPDYQVILKKDGSRRTTSVAKHTEFIRSRTRSSDKFPGRVRFNECVRLMKWWRYERIRTSGTIDIVRTTLIELLCASAYDKLGVETTYTATLFRWFSWLASVAARRLSVEFSDYQSIEVRAEHVPGNQLWRVIDPVNANNNVVHGDWGNLQLKELATWFAEGRDALGRASAYEEAGNDSTVDQILDQLFGSAIANHGVLE